MTTQQGALLVGSVNFDDAESTIRTASEILGDRLRRIPDGEPGKRFHWILFQADVIGSGENVARVGDTPFIYQGMDNRGVRIADGRTIADVRLPALGYAAAAIESYQTFTRLREEGVVAAGTRFQVSLPTPVGVVGSFVPLAERADFERLYTTAMLGELDDILAAIPHADLAIQWDVCVEFGILEHAVYEAIGGTTYDSWFDGDDWDELTSRTAALVDAVPADVEVGLHLCYGDASEVHFKDPEDTAILTRFTNLVTEHAERTITWVHLPVPISRDDVAYFQPLAELALAESTELYLGLIHREDLTEGAQRRIAAAAQVVDAFGVATECGIGRAPEGTTAGILQAHADVAKAW